MLTASEIEEIKLDMLQRSQDLFLENAGKIQVFLNEKSLNPNDMVPLIAYTLERADMVMFLSRHGNLEDAEIIFRSMLEAFIKFIYSLSEDIAIVKQRIKEYWHITNLHEKKRKSDMLKRIYASDMVIPESHKIGVLTKEEEQAIISNPDYGDGRYRKMLKESWSFSGMIKAIEETNKIKPRVLTSLTALSQHYSVASHIAHADKVGIDIIRRSRFSSPYNSSVYSLYQLLKLLRITNETIAALAINLYRMARNESEFNKVKERLQIYCDYSWSKNIIVYNIIQELKKNI